MSLRDWKVDNKQLRLDSEFQKRAFLGAIELIRKGKSIQFRDDEPDIIHPQEIPRRYVDVTEDGVWFLRAQNVRPLKIDPTNKVYISSSDADQLSRNKILSNDILITRTGANRGDCAMYDREEKAIASSHTFLVRPTSLNSAWLTVFFNSSYGKAQIDKGVYGAAQPEVAPYYLRNIWLPSPSQEFSTFIESTFEKSKTLQAASEKKLLQAEEHLLLALGLADWQPPEPLSYVASSKDAFASGRLDAQYFMPAKEQVRRALAAMPGKPLGERVNSIREMLVPNRAPNDLKVRNYDVTDALTPILDAAKETIIANEIGSTKKQFKNGDVVISRLRAYLKEIAVVRTNDHIPLVGSSEFIVLRPNRGENKVSPETLMVFLRSTPVQTILKWCQDGSQHPRFSERDLLSISVPDVVLDVSEEVTSLVQDGFAARNKSFKLLEQAKRAVEVAIEANEEAAIAFLNTNNMGEY